MPHLVQTMCLNPSFAQITGLLVPFSKSLEIVIATEFNIFVSVRYETHTLEPFNTTGYIGH